MHRSRPLVLAVLLLPLACKSLQPTPKKLFYEALVGQSKSLPVFWTNNGKNNITVDLIDIVGDTAFTLAGPPVVPGFIPPDGFTPVMSVVFSPATRGEFHATAIPSSLTGQDMDAQEVELVGFADYPMDVDSPYMVGKPAPIPAGAATHKIDFGDIVAGTTSYRTVNLRSRNPYPQAVLLRFAPNRPFSAHVSASANWAIWGQTVPGPTGQVTIVLKFKPQTPGAFQDTLQFWTRAGTHFLLDLEGRAHAG
jgi:hypothetical protein